MNMKMTNTTPLTRHHLEREANRLRYEANLAYLDGRTKRYRELHKRADALEAQARKLMSEA